MLPNLVDNIVFGTPFESLPFFCRSSVASKAKGCFPLGGIFRAERNFFLSFLISPTREITRQRKIPLRAQIKFRLMENRLNTIKFGTLSSVRRLKQALRNSIFES
jgi:hypothetical protein